MFELFFILLYRKNGKGNRLLMKKCKFAKIIFPMKNFLYVLAFMMCCMKCVAQTYIEPVFDRTDVPSLHINKIEVTKDTTVVHCTYKAEAGSWARISKDTYLYDRDKKKKYTILRCSGLPFSPQKRNFLFGGFVQISFLFPNIGNATKLDFIEEPNEEAFNIYGINVKEQFKSSYKETDYEHFSNMSSIYDNAGNDSLAIQYKGKEVEATKYIHGIKSMEYFNSLLGACFMYDKYEFYKEAINGMNYLKDIHTEVWGEEDKYNYAMFVRTLAQFYSHASDNEMSIKTYEEAMDLFESIHAIDNEYALALRFIAHEYSDIEDNVSSLLYQQKAIEVRRNIGDSDEYVNELYDVALTTPANKEFAKARIHIVEKELESLPDFVDTMSVAFVDIYEKIAFSYTLLEDNSRSIQYLDRALTLLKEKGLDDSEKCADVLGEKCRYQKWANLVHEAISTGRKGKHIYEALHVKSSKYAELLDDLAGIYSNIEDYEQAIQIQEAACTIYEEAQDWLSLAEGLNYIGICYRNKYDFDKAEMYILKGLNILSNNVIVEQYVTDAINESQREKSLSVIQDRIERAKAGYYSELAKVYLEKGEKLRAIEAEKEVGKILQVMPNDQNLYNLHLSGLATLYRENEEFEEAIRCEEQSLKFWENLGQKDYIIATQYNLAITYFAKGDTIRAIEHIKNGILTSRSNDNKLLVEGMGNLAIFYWKSSRYEEAKACLSECLDFIRDMLYQEVGKMTSEQKQRGWNHYRNLFILYRNLICVNGSNGKDVAKLYNYVLFSKNLLLDSDSYKDDNWAKRMNITWKDIQSKLSEDDIAIEFITTIEERTDTIQYGVYHALVIDKECKHPEMITLICEKALIGEHEDIGGLIWKPILARYKNVKSIYFSADGVWHAVPIENYYVDSIGIISDKYDMYRLSSTKELVKQRKEFEFESAVLYGGLTYSAGDVLDLAKGEGEHAQFLRGIEERGGFEPLYNTFTETKEIQEILKQGNIETTLYTEENGTEECFKQLSGQGVNIIHLATHGMYVDIENLEKKRDENNFNFLESINDKDPVHEDAALTRSFLVMSNGNKLVQRNGFNEGDDGILTAKEISKMDLTGLDLVVLSACETALGEMTVSDGIFGLQRGFKKAGANTIIMSTNKVDDEATKILMIELYKNLMSGKSKLQSLKDAQKYLREYDNGEYDKPEYWASFIMLDGLN